MIPLVRYLGTCMGMQQSYTSFSEQGACQYEKPLTEVVLCIMVITMRAGKSALPMIHMSLICNTQHVSAYDCVVCLVSFTESSCTWSGTDIDITNLCHVAALQWRCLAHSVPCSVSQQQEHGSPKHDLAPMQCMYQTQPK